MSITGVETDSDKFCSPTHLLSTKTGQSELRGTDTDSI